MTKPTYRFNLDLDRSRAPHPFEDTENLWRDELRRLYRLLRSHVALLESDNGTGVARPHLSIAIFGPAGSGKSSLLKTLHADIRRKKKGVLSAEKGDLASAVTALPVIDPTTWAASDQFLYAFLASALEEERSRAEDEQGTARGLSSVQLAFQEVNEYLRVVDDPGRADEHDPLGLSLHKLERHTSGIRLREKIDIFLRELSKELGKKIILLPVDDLDMTPLHLVDSLKDYQSFLTHPNLVPVFTFTDRMPEEIIESHYRRYLHLQKVANAGGSEPLSISEKMAVQFLARCFPVRNRIRLGPAPGRVQRAAFKSRRSTSSMDEDSIEVIELLTTGSFLLFGHPDGDDAHNVRAALRPSTLRRQLQVVDALEDCRINILRAPQLYGMAKPGVRDSEEAIQRYETFEALTGPKDKKKPDTLRKYWEKWPSKEHRLRRLWKKRCSGSRSTQRSIGRDYDNLVNNMISSKNGATWGQIFNAAAWSLLNVHRDTLRELGLYLEDLYSWHPKELQSFVLNKILEKDHTVRRTLVDRWFNRTDYRRSQVLSLLAANIFRPWMYGEEPYGDDEVALNKHGDLERDHAGNDKALVDSEWESSDKKFTSDVALDRVSFRSVEGFLWFLNLNLGFYLPQIMARNWSDALSPERPVKEHMGGNGWDLSRAPINAMRIADARQEAFSYGMLFLDPPGYRHALESAEWAEHLRETPKSPKADDLRERQDLWGSQANTRDHLLLRIWSCFGYGRGHYWAALSLWRGLGLIGEVLQVGLKHRDVLASSGAENDIKDDLHRLIYSHCMSGMVPGAFLGRGSSETKLLNGFPKWPLPRKPSSKWIDRGIEELTDELLTWLRGCWEDRIFPIPAGRVYISWRDCFIRRIHGEYILGYLWPRLNASYLEEQSLCADDGNGGVDKERECKIRKLAFRRSLDKHKATEHKKKEGEAKHKKEEEEKKGSSLRDPERFRWTAWVAAGTWSDVLYEYWRGCPPILRLLATCPLFFESEFSVGKELRSKLRSGVSTSARKVNEELAIERVHADDFASWPLQRHSIKLEKTEIKYPTEKSGVKTVVVKSPFDPYPQLEDCETSPEKPPGSE